ncbi:hypothetical protein T06_5339 [Trichinella sp. T6]|nr:hypothetical protein T06_5339 [Trichinella sp. T6]
MQILFALFVHRLRYLQLTGNDLLHCAFLFNDVSSHWQNANDATRRVISRFSIGYGSEFSSILRALSQYSSSDNKPQ